MPSPFSVVIYSIVFSLIIIILIKPSWRKEKSIVLNENLPKDLASTKKGDLFAIVIDNATNEIKLLPFIKIDDRLFLSISSTPTFLLLPETAEVYKCKIGKKMRNCVLAYTEGNIATMLDPRLVVGDTLLTNDKKGIIKFDDSLDDLLAKILEYGKQRKVELPVGETKVGIVLNTRNLIRRYINQLRIAGNTLMHFVNATEQVEKMRDLLMKGIELQKAKYSWLKYLFYIIIAIGLAIAMAQMFTHGGGHPPTPPHIIPNPVGTGK